MQIAIIQTLQAQVEEMRKKSMEDQRRNEEKVFLLKEQNKELKQRLNGSKQEEQSRTETHHNSMQTERSTGLWRRGFERTSFYRWNNGSTTPLQMEGTDYQALWRFHRHGRALERFQDTDEPLHDKQGRVVQGFPYLSPKRDTQLVHLTPT